MVFPEKDSEKLCIHFSFTCLQIVNDCKQKCIHVYKLVHMLYYRNVNKNVIVVNGFVYKPYFVYKLFTDLRFDVFLR